MVRILIHFLVYKFKLITSLEVRDPTRGNFTKEIYWVNSLALSWTSANSFCRDFNMDLLTLADKNEETMFVALMHRIPEFHETFAHIGGTVLGSPNWYWLQSGQDISFALDWFPGEPNNGSGEEFCMAIGNIGGVTGIFDLDCYGTGQWTRQPFVCQRLVRN